MTTPCIYNLFRAIYWHTTCDFPNHMNRRMTLAILLAFAVVSCGRSKTMQRGQQQYDVVQEGSSSSTSTAISAPGEAPPPLSTAPLTNTNVDTTTAFTVPGTTVATDTTPPGTIASTLPTPATQRPRPQTPPRTIASPPAQTPTNPPAATSTAPTTPPVTDSAQPTPPPSSTDTTGTQ